MKQFIFGSYVYEYSLSREDRKTLSLTVMPDLRIILKCPYRANDERIEAFLRRKWFWLQKQLSFFKKYQRKGYSREYVSGESYLYLGRQYKLHVKKSSEDRVILSRGILQVYTTRLVSETSYTKKLLMKWYAQKAEIIFEEQFSEMLKKFDYNSVPRLVIKEMPKRWGSFISKEKIALNPKLIHTARECIDYVIVHELCHIKYKNHDKKFFECVKRKCPKWQVIKEKLEMYFF